MSEPTMVECSYCDERFYVVWERSATTLNGPEHCPFCGEIITSDYIDAPSSREGETL